MRHDTELAGRLTGDHYALLGVSADASAGEIKTAYHRTLLAHHPDKTGQNKSMDFAELKRAYETLSSPKLRAEYDSQQRTDARQKGASQRPAQVVSLDEFTEHPDGVWRYPCRCGRSYVLLADDLERDVHLVGCEGCSEVVWAGYEAVDS